MPTKSTQRILFSALSLIYFALMQTACSTVASNKIVDPVTTNSPVTPPLHSISSQMSESQIIHNRPTGSAKTKVGTLIINSPKVTVGNAPKPIPKMPKRGVSMDDVIAEFGNPNSKHGPVGKPPISRWFYDDFKVVFEYNHVIQSVANR